jgi:Archaeal fructose-1,6-bisphosphatase and related enzymes of inositol monophosphatase family
MIKRQKNEEWQIVERIFGQVEKIIYEAGRLIKNAAVSSYEIFTKGPANYVTEVDYNVQTLIVKNLKELMPGCNIITEENDNNLYDLSKPTWILDPVDGTTNLIYQYGMSSISLGLFIERIPVMSFVYNPFNDELFTAFKGKGSFLNGNQVKISAARKLEDSVIAFGTTPYDRSMAHPTFKLLEALFMKSRDVRRGGSAALDFTYIACGRQDGFFELCLQPWDYAAGILIVEEAGGRITDMEGMPLSLTKPSSVLASNGMIHSEMLDTVKQNEILP